MAASDQKLRSRIMRLDAELQQRPRLHVARISLYIAFGYLWPVVLLGLCTIAAAALLPAFRVMWSEVGWEGIFIWAMLLGLVAFIAFLLLQSLRNRETSAWGMRITPQDAPDLFRLIEQVRHACNGPEIGRVHLDWQMNAGIARIGRSGLWERREHALILGVPLLAAMSPEDLQCVLAHEIGHLQGNRDPFGGWVYRVVSTWTALTRDQGSKASVGGRLMGWFARRYVPWISAATLPARRRHECRADETSLRAFGAQRSARALARLEWVGYRIGRTLTVSIWHEAAQSKLPPDDYVQRVCALLESPVEPLVISGWQRLEGKRKSVVTDEHPSLLERLQNLGATDTLERPADFVSCARPDGLSLLGPSRDRVIRYANTSWKASVIAPWRQEYAVAQHLARESREDEHATPEGEAARVYTELQADPRYRDPITARPLIAEFLISYPDHAEANFDLGRIMLHEDDEAGIELVKKAMEVSSAFASPCLSLLLNHHRSAGRDAEADEILKRYDTFSKSVQAHKKHIARLTRDERLLPHDLPVRKLRQLQAMVARFPQVEAAYLARRNSRVFHDRPIYLLAVQLSGLRRADHRLIRGIEDSMPVDCTVVVMPRFRAKLRRHILDACPGPIFDDRH